MNKNITMEDLKLVYDRENNKFGKAFVTIDGEKYIVTGNTEVRNIMNAYASERGVDDIRKIPNEYSLAYTTNPKVVSSFETKYEGAREIKTSKKPAGLKKENPYNNQTANIANEDLADFDEKKWKRVSLASIGAIIGLSLIAAGYGHFNSKANEEQAIVEEVKAKIVKKEAPESWPQYEKEYVSCLQKTFSKGNLKGTIEDNIVTSKIGDEEFTYTFSIEEITALNYKYNTFHMSFEDILKTYGDYGISSPTKTNYINDARSGLMKMAMSLACAKDVEDVLDFKYEDEVCQQLWDKYVTLVLKFKNSSSPKSVGKEIEEEYRKDFISVNKIEVTEHPAIGQIAETVNLALFYNNYSIKEEIREQVLGQRTNQNVDGIEDTIEKDGLPNAACGVMEDKMERYKEYYEKLYTPHEVAKANNDRLLKEVNMDKNDEKGQAYYDELCMEDEFAEITINTYSLEDEINPLIKEELIKNNVPVDVNYIELKGKLLEAKGEELRNKQLNNTKPFNHKTNPTGGKPGDKSTEYLGKQTNLTEKQLLDSGVTQQQLEEAKLQDQKETGIIDKNNKEAIAKKDEEVRKATEAERVAAEELGQKHALEYNGDASKKKVYSDIELQKRYNIGWDRGIAFLKVKQEAEKEIEKIPESEQVPEFTPEEGEYAGSHEQNPNQNGTNNPTVEDVPIVEEIITTPGPVQESTPQTPTVSQPEVSQPVVDPSLGEMGGSHDENSNQNTGNTTYNIDTTDVIQETITTDSTGVEDMSQYGEVQEASITSYSVEQIIDSYIEELADPNSEINMVVETPNELAK